MKRVVIDRWGDPAEVVRVEEAPEPDPPGPHEALVALEASPIHPSDLLTIEGKYPSKARDLPKVPGKEGVGRVVAVGGLVRHLKPGDLTPILSGSDGVWQQLQRLPAEGLVALPPAGDILQYAMGIANPATGLLLLREVVPIGMGEWVIQNAANSAVGQLLIQHARRLGIRTINVVRREGLADKLHGLGADVVLVDGPDLAKQVKSATGGAALRLAIDAVAGEASARLAACLSRGGVLVNYGALSGENVQVAPFHLVGSGIVVRGFWLATSPEMATPEGRGKVFGELIPLIASGVMRASVEAVYPLDRAAEAVAHAARGGREGKVLLTK